MLLIPSVRNLISANEDGDVSISSVTRTRDPEVVQIWETRDMTSGRVTSDKTTMRDGTQAPGQPDMCQNLSSNSTKQISSLLLGKSERLQGVCPVFGWCISNRDWLNLLLRAVMDWLLVSCNKQRHQGDRCGLVTIKIQKLYWSHYSENTPVLARQRLLTGDDVI